MKHKIYERQIQKTALSQHVVDTEDADRQYDREELTELYEYNQPPLQPCAGSSAPVAGSSMLSLRRFMSMSWSVPTSHVGALQANFDEVNVTPPSSLRLRLRRTIGDMAPPSATEAVGVSNDFERPLGMGEAEADARIAVAKGGGGVIKARWVSSRLGVACERKDG